ncbi:MAG: MerR family transcriptional regulator [Candidatus Aminicenantes bacterium]|nr:MerR family transcriptional regulator [Candidatus Aminicenantes bacterium]
MNKRIYSRDELSSRFGLPEEMLREWETFKFLRPVGYTDERMPLYAEDIVEKFQHVQRLQNLGYGIEEIQKIIKKVGLPGSGKKEKGRDEEDEYLTVGSLAERVGLSPRTIKHWEDKGIIEPDMRTEGGFRLYSRVFVYLCELIRDLQLFGYTLEEIKKISDEFRDFLVLKDNLEACPRDEAARKLDGMLAEIKSLFDRMKLIQEGIERWEDLLKKKRKEVLDLKARNLKRGGNSRERKK